MCLSQSMMEVLWPAVTAVAVTPKHLLSQVPTLSQLSMGQLDALGMYICMHATYKYDYNVLRLRFESVRAA